MRRVRVAAVVLLLPCLRVWAQEGTEKVSKAMEGAWKDLAAAEPKATRGLLTFQDHPVEAVAFLKTRVLPLKLTEEELKPLLEALGSEEDAVWKPAYEKLRYLDPRLAMPVDKLDEQVTTEPARTRLVAVLVNTDPKNLGGGTFRLERNGDNYLARNDRSGYWVQQNIGDIAVSSKPAWRQAAGGLAVLHVIGTPEALEVVNECAKGNAESAVTKLAKEYSEAAPATEPDIVAKVEGWWADLGTTEKSAVAALEFGRNADVAVSFFQDQLKPLTITPEEVRSAIADLGSDDEKVWKAADEKLRYFDPRLAIDVKTLVNETTDGTARARLVALLTNNSADNFMGKDIEVAEVGGNLQLKVQQGNGTSYWYVEPKVSRVSHSEWQRLQRAIMILSHTGTQAAVEVLQRIAGGNAEAGPTKTAMQEVKRLTGGQ